MCSANNLLVGEEVGEVYEDGSYDYIHVLVFLVYDRRRTVRKRDK